MPSSMRAFPLRGFFQAFRLTLRHCLRGRRTLLFAGIGAALVALERVALGRGPTVEGEPAFVFFLGKTVLGFLGPLVALFYGLSAFNDDVEDRTIVYLVVRPVPRASILLGKFLAAATTAALVSSATTVGLYVMARGHARAVPFPSGSLPAVLLVVVLGAAAYVSVYAVLAMLLRNPILAGMAHAFVWETFLPNMPIQLRNLTISLNLRGLLAAWVPGAEGVTQGFGRRTLLLPPPTGTEAAVFLLVVGGLALLSAAVLFHYREWSARTDS